MNVEFVEALNELCKTRRIKKEVLLEAIEQALMSAYKKNFDSNSNARVTLDAVTGEALRQAQCPCDAKIDCLIANLPYIPDSEKGKLQPEVDKFDPALALYGGPDGLSLVRKLLQQTEGKLNAGASILLEIGSEQAEVLKNEAANFPWLEFAGIHKDYCGNIRFVSYKSK